MSFGHKIITPDPKISRPETIEDKRELVRQVYKENGWTAREHGQNCEMEGFPLKRIDDYTTEELQLFIDDFVKRKMLILR